MMNPDTEISVVFTAEQMQALLQLMTQVDVKGTPSMRVVLGIENTLMQAVRDSSGEE